MKTWNLHMIAFIAVIGLNASVFAQDDDEHGHSDVEFAYEDGKIAIEFSDEGAVFEGEFSTEGVDLQFTSEPGFGSEGEEGLGINAGDQIVYNVLSELMYWNDGFKPVPGGAQIRIVNRPPSPVVPDTIIGADTAIQFGSFVPALNRIGAGEADGDLHSDLDFLLEPKGDTADSALFGVYGFLLSLSTDEAGVAASDPFAMVFNFGVEEEKFAIGVGAFANVVPEPSGYTIVLSVCVLAFGCIRRRRICSKNQ
ncbi:MAG: hypothetical protein KDB27_02195 [Planctomycetales bacterium]|nr:hypothetical protein [Planctomycetales bacterium]